MNTKEYKNYSERKCVEELMAKGWTYTKRGWPDFICYRNDQVICVEVKSSKYEPLKADQIRVMDALSKCGVECGKYSPDGGFEKWQDIRKREILNRTKRNSCYSDILVL